MLVLNRKVGEVICIGETISIYGVKIQRDKVRLGVDAPAEVPVHRKEVAMRLKAERKPVDESAECPAVCHLLRSTQATVGS